MVQVQLLLLAPTSVALVPLAMPQPVKLPDGWNDFGSCGPEACISDEEAFAEEARMELLLPLIHAPSATPTAFEGETAAVEEPDLDLNILSPLEERIIDEEVALAAAAGTDDEVPSWQLVQVDDAGTPTDLDGSAFAFVDEIRCNGCALCSAIAPATFFAEPTKGKGRCFLQGGDDLSTIDEATQACPTGAIRRLRFDDLKKAEIARSAHSTFSHKRPQALRAARARQRKNAKVRGDLVHRAVELM